MASASRPAGVSLMKSASAVFMNPIHSTEQTGSILRGKCPTHGHVGRPCAHSGASLADDHLEALGTRLVARVVYAPQQLTRRLRRQRAAEQKPLRVLTLLLLQECELGEVLHAFGRYIDA